MKNFLIIGDLHLTGLDITDITIINFLNEVIKLDDEVIFLGDVFDTFDVSVKPNLFYKFLSNIKNNVNIILGNHCFNRNRSWAYIMIDLKPNIKVIKEYEFEDYDDYRFHYYNYFRYSRDIEFQLHPDKRNILFSHADLIPNNPIKGFSDFNGIFNGHIHDFSVSENRRIYNVGSIRKTAINELDDKNIFRLSIGEKEDLQRIQFKSVVDIQRVSYTELSEASTFDRPTILNVMFSGHESKKEELEKIKGYKWYDENKILLKDELAKDDKFILETLENIETKTANFDFMKIFSDYFDFYVTKYKVVDLDKEEMIKEFRKHYDNKKSEIVEFKINNINFESAECKNFRLFEEAKIDFKMLKGSIFIKGENHDEVVDDTISSNESGKSCVMQIILFTLLGSDSKVVPLRRKTKSGITALEMIINEVKIRIERRFTKSTNDVFIFEDGESFYKDETNTDKLKMFFEKYNFLDALQFIFLSNNGFVNNFFQSRSSERFRIFRDTFPIIQHVSEITSYIKEKMDEEKKVFETLNTNLNHIKEIRTLKYKFIKEALKEINGSEINKSRLNELSSGIEEYKKGIEQPEHSESDLNVVYDLVKNESDFTFISKIFGMNYGEVLKSYSTKRDLESITKKIEASPFKTFEIKEEMDKIDLQDLYRILDSKVKNDNMFMLQKSIGLDKDYLRSVFNIDISGFEKKYEEYDKKQEDFKKLGQKYKDLEQQIKFDEENNKGVECDKCGNVIKDPSVINFINEKKNKLKQIFEDGKACKKWLDDNASVVDESKKQIAEVKLAKERVNKLLKESKVSIDEYLNYEIREINTDDVTNKIIKKKKYDEDKILFEEYRKMLVEKENLQREYKAPPEFQEDEFIKKYQSVVKIKELFPEVSIKDLKVFIVKNLGLCHKYKNLMSELNILQKNYDVQKALYDEVVKKKDRIRKDIEDTQKNYSIRALKEQHKIVEKSYKVLDNLYYVLNNRGITFEKFFVNMFFQQIEKIFNVLLSFVFERDVKLNISDLEFQFEDEGEKCYYNDFSSGGKIKLSLCFLLTFNIIFQEYGTKSNIQWIDEFLDEAMDEVNSKRVFKLLQHYFKGLLFIVSHKPFFNEFIDKEMLIVRKDGKSEIFIKGV